MATSIKSTEWRCAANPNSFGAPVTQRLASRYVSSTRSEKMVGTTHLISHLSSKEALSGVIELRHDKPETVRAMLEFCYTFTYTCRPSDSPEDRMIFHVHVYALGEVYDITGLKKLAVQNFGREANHTFPLFPAAVRAVYETTPQSDRGLRDVVLRICAANASELMNKPHFESMDELGVFGRELSRTLAGRSTYATSQDVIVDCKKYRIPPEYLEKESHQGQ
ncbi:hypothetical protein MPH_00329 [Macrophomina phaseolina MS6]|uniref:BTB/POZ-like protein n=1 Tax=Macrophomina phaseolina (strain MS6) TaxID=1126212 RepID=K2SIQ1_MACPH|nr:hypothetical protein MPH_00329 [Macrophomina phaseolina MS6]